MTKFEAATAECQQLAQIYYQLPTVEQKIIQLFAVIYEPINRTAFLTCLNQSGCRNENGKAFNDSTLKLNIDKLLTSGLLIQERAQGPQCHRLLTEIATRHAVKIGTFEAIATTVQQRLPIARSYTNGPRYFQNQRQFMRELRIGIYRQDLKFMNQVVEDYYKYANQDKILINEYQRSIKITLLPFGVGYTFSEVRTKKLWKFTQKLSKNSKKLRGKTQLISKLYLGYSSSWRY